MEAAEFVRSVHYTPQASPLARVWMASEEMDQYCTQLHAQTVNALLPNDVLKICPPPYFIKEAVLCHTL